MKLFRLSILKCFDKLPLCFYASVKPPRATTGYRLRYEGLIQARCEGILTMDFWTV